LPKGLFRALFDLPNPDQRAELIIRLKATNPSSADITDGQAR